MPAVTFSALIYIDKDFYNETIKKTNPDLANKLMYINAKSKEHKRCHNSMSKKDFDGIVSGLSKKSDNKERSFRPIDEPTEIENIVDEFERNIKYAVELATKPPAYKTIILTTDGKRGSYLKNAHLRGLSTISVKSGIEAIELINNFYKETILT